MRKRKFKNEIVIAFIVDDFKDETEVDAITLALGIQPTKVNLIGNRNPLGGPIRRNRWALALPTCEKYDFEFALYSILDVLESSAGAIKELSKKYSTAISCAIYHFDKSVSFPSIQLKERYNKFVTATNVELDIDVYVW